MSSSDDFEVIDQLEASLPQEDLAKIQAWLEPTDYEAPSSEFNRHLQSQAPGTGLWICETSKYKQWQQSPEHGSLWVKGIPGAGKSVTAASMIDHLKKTDSGVPVLSFFFRYIISANRRPRSLIRDFLAQLVPYSARLQATLQPLLITDLEDYSDGRLWEYLLDGLCSVEKAYCVVDAMDEMEFLVDDGFLERLNKLATFKPNNVKLLMTSRPKQYLQSGLRDASIVHISLEDDLVGKDISIFLSYRLKNIIPDGQTILRESLAATISERSGGLFLYARLLLDQIAPKLGVDGVDVAQLVKDLPIGLEDMYNTVLHQQAAALKIDVQIQLFLLELATHSSRALRLNEMASALASAFPPSMLPDFPKVVVRSACAPLLEISEDETVQVIHHSFTEFLLNSERSNSGNAQFPILNHDLVHKKLTIICLDYLRSGILHQEQPEAPGLFNKEVSKEHRRRTTLYWDDGDKEAAKYDYQQAKLRYPFLEYAASTWAFHASKYDIVDDEFFESIAEFLNPNSPDFKKWLELEWIKAPKPSEIQPPTPLHIAAFAGLTTYATRLLTVFGGSIPVDARDGEERTPLHWACARGHTAMVSLLLENGAATDPEDVRGVKPIHEAARRNCSGVVKMLLEAGVDPITPKTRENVNRRVMCGEVSTIGETALEYAWLQGHTETIMVMAPFLMPKTLEELFCQCCRYGKFEAVRALLDTTKLSANSKYSGATALYLSCRAHSPAIVELLLARGADVHSTSQWKVTNRNGCGSRVREEPVMTPIHGTVKGWKDDNNAAAQQVLRLLLNAGADIELRDVEENTPLLSLFNEEESPSTVILKGFLQAGANVHAVDKKGDTVLHRYLSVGHDIQVLKLLFDYGAQVDELGQEGNTVLHTALGNYNRSRTNRSTSDLVRFLLEIGARCDVKNKQGVTAIEDAAFNFDCSPETFTALVEACSDMDALQGCIWKVRSRTEYEAIDYIQALQKRGVSLEDRKDDGMTVLLSHSQDKDLLDALIRCGADLQAVDSKGRGLLHHYVADCWVHQAFAAVKGLVDLVEMGLDPKEVDADGNNLLHIRGKRYKDEESDNALFQKFFDYGLSINSKNKQGMTPLHVYLENHDFHDPNMRSPVSAGFNRRFLERDELSLLRCFKTSQQSLEIDAQDTDGVTILHMAALRSETLLFYLLQEGADPNILTKSRRNILHLACRARQSNVVRYLCSTNRDLVNQQDEFGRTPLHDACTSGCPESVCILLKAGADTTTVDKNERTALHSCAEFADEQKLWTILGRQNKESGHLLYDKFRPGPGKSSTNIKRYESPWYAEKSRVDDRVPDLGYLSAGLVVKALLNAGLDPMAIDMDRKTPLDLAIEYDCKEMIAGLSFCAELLHKKWEIKSGNERLRTAIALKGASSLPGINTQSLSLQELIRSPLEYRTLIGFDDIEWMSHNLGDILESSQSRSNISKHGLLYLAVSNGFTELVEGFSHLACINDDPKVVLARIKEQPEAFKTQTLRECSSPMLHIACDREIPNIDTIKALIETCGVNINARGLVEPSTWAKKEESIEGGTALHVLAKAYHSWQLDAFRYLLKKGADIEAVNQKGETPLHIACTGPTYSDMNCIQNTYGLWRIECVKLLLDGGANVNTLDNDGLSCLHKAASSPQIMKILLENDADISLGTISPLFSAIQIQCLETLMILLDAGVSANILDPHKNEEGFKLNYMVKDKTRPALFCASFASLMNQRTYHSTPMVKLLIERGADVYALLDDKDTLIHYTFEFAEYEILPAYLDCGPLIDFDARDSTGRTVLLAACDWREILPGYEHKHWERKEVAPFLRILELGANPSVVDKDGRNLLHHLLDNPDMQEESIIQFLSQEPAKSLLHQKDAKGFTPLDCALRILRPDVVEVLLNMGANLLNPDPTGATAIHHIAGQCLRREYPSKHSYSNRECKPEFYTGALSLWKKFLALGGSINVRDNKGNPPLFLYLSSSQRDDYKAPETGCCHLESFKTYFSDELASDVDFQAKNNDGENALHIIARREVNCEKMPMHNKELYEFFMAKGLNPLDEDASGRSSLDVAAACEQHGILELFQYRK